MSLKTLAHSGLRLLLTERANLELLLPLSDFAALDSTLSTQSCARLALSAFSFDFAHPDPLASLQQLHRIALLVSVVGAAMSGAVLSVPDHTQVESSSPLQFSARMDFVMFAFGSATSDSSLFLQRSACLDSALLSFGSARLGDTAPLPDFVMLGLAVSARSCAHLDPVASVPDFVTVEPSILTRNFARTGLAMFAISHSRSGFVTPVLDMLQLESTSLLRSLA